MQKERIQKIMAMKVADLEKERGVLVAGILGLRVDIANHKTGGIHKIKQMKRDIARINTALAMRKENYDK
ncbi:MAG: 50S ribosomal protein L29 [Candidatus Berkelbacteria bacterium]